jgi:hypothetical protein
MSNLTRASLVVLLAAVALSAAGPIVEGDTFWHLAIGRHLLQHHHFAHPDPFVWTAPAGGHDVLHEWLAELIMATLARAGLGAMRVLRAALATAIVLVIFLAARRRAPPALAFTTAVAAWIFLLPNLSARPHLFGLLAAATLVALPPGPAAIPILILWANLHSSVLIAPLIAGCQLLECAVRRHPELRPWALRTAVALAATLVQPAGWRLWPYALGTPAVNREFSDEWMPLFDARLAGDLNRVAWVVLAALVITALVIAARGDRQVRFPGALAALACLAFAASNRRMTAFLFLPLLHVADVLAHHVRLSLRRALGEAWMAAAALTALAVALPRLRPGPPVAPGAFPEETARFLAAHHLEGRLFNPEAWGGYLSWTLAPDYRVFADGRWPLVGRTVIADSIAIMSRRPEAQALLDRYGIEVLVEATRFHLRVPGLDPRRWAVAHADATAVVLLRRGPHYQSNAARACGDPVPTVQGVPPACLTPLPGSPGR